MRINVKSLSIHLGIFLVSLATISVEVFLNRMFSLTYWYHFAFLIISIALFGIGLGGVISFFLNFFVKKSPNFWLFLFSILLGVSLMYSIYHANLIPLETELLGKSPKHAEYFRDIFLLLSIPFVFSGIIFSIVFTNFSNKINSLYFADLVGGGIGCFFVLLLFPGRGPIVMTVIVASVFFLAGLFFILSSYKWYIRSLLVLISLGLIFFNFYYIYPESKNIEVRVSNSKRNLATIGKPIYTHWDNFTYVAVHDLKKYYRIYGDYAVITPLLPMKGIAPIDLIGHFRAHLYPFVLKKGSESVFIVGAGGGREIVSSLAYNIKNIDAVEFNPTFFYLLKEKFKEYTGNLVERPGVNLIMKEARHQLKSTHKKYDIIIFNNSISITAATSGANTLSESYLFTVEAFMDYINRLKPDGVIYLSNPYSDVDRFITVIREAFNRLRLLEHFKKRIIVSFDFTFQNYKKCKILIKNGDFTKEDVSKIKNYIDDVKHTLLYAPFNKTNTYQEKLILTDNIEKEYMQADSEIRPSTDNWPFFTQRIRTDSLKEKTKTLEKVKYFYPQPFLIIKAMSETVLKYSLIFLLLPLIILNLGGLRRVKNKVGSIIYFASLGLGFMFIEVIFVQKFVLFLGHPLYAFSVVIATILIASGLGSLFSKKISDNPYKTILIALSGIIIAVCLNIMFFKFLSGYLISLSFFFRVLISVLLIGITGFFMGIFMPTGISVVAGYNEMSVPWMWAINGVFSVLASFMTVYLSIIYGFNIVLLIGVGIYIIGTLFFVLLKKLKF